jgi:hypothetical protein
MELHVTIYKKYTSIPSLREKMVGLAGLEPATPRLSSVCSNQLSYRPRWRPWWRHADSNRRHSACKADALPTELYPLLQGCVLLQMTKIKDRIVCCVTHSNIRADVLIVVFRCGLLQAPQPSSFQLFGISASSFYFKGLDLSQGRCRETSCASYSVERR